MKQNPQGEKHRNTVHHVSECAPLFVVTYINVPVCIIDQLHNLIQQGVGFVSEDAIVKILSHCLSLCSG